jgi:hypothetical protein
MNLCIITHPELGVFLGTFLGFGIWSKLDPMDQDAAVVFKSPEHAQQFTSSWSDQLSGLSYLPVVPDLPNGAASVAACVAAGAEGWLFADMATAGGLQ